MRNLVSALVSVLVVLTACTTPANPGGGSNTNEPQAGGRIIQGVAEEFTSMLSLISGDGSEIAWGSYYPRLMQSNPETGDLDNGLATKWELSPDARNLTFTLRPGVKWSDGMPFTGEDYKYSVEASLRAKQGVRKVAVIEGHQAYRDGTADTVSGLTVSPDGLTVTIKLTTTLCTAARNLAAAGGGIIPKHHFIRYFNNKSTDLTQTLDQTPLNDAPPASLGPWVFKEWQRGIQVSATKNENYWRGAPLVDEYIIKLYSTPAAVKAGLLTGEVDFGVVSPGDVEEIEAAGRGLKLSKQKIAINYNVIVWNLMAPKAPWLANRDVRQALWHGLNIPAIIENVLDGYATQVYSHTPSDSWAYDETGFNKYGYSVARAQDLLQKAGATMGTDGIYRWTDGSRMSMRLEGTPPSADLIQVAQEQYRAIGISIDPLVIPGPSFTERNRPTFLDREGSITGWTISPDPDGAYIFFHSANQGANNFNRSRYSNPSADRALEQGRVGPLCTNAARKPIYVDLNRQLNADAPWTWLYAPDSLMFYKDAVQNLSQKPYGLTTSGETWDHNAEKIWLKR